MKVTKKAIQGKLPGVETPEIIQELTDAALSRWNLVEERKGLQKRITKASEALIVLMKQHKKKRYVDVDAGLIVTLDTPEAKIHVTLKGEDDVPEGAVIPGQDEEKDEDEGVSVDRDDVPIDAGTLEHPEIPAAITKPEKPKRSHKKGGGKTPSAKK